MEIEKRYCNICRKECEYKILMNEDKLEARRSSHVVASSPYTTIIVISRATTVKGGNILGTQIIPARQWLEKCGVEVKSDYAILFKSLNRDYITRNGISFKPKTYHEAPDWDIDFKEECGCGIHYSPTVAQARTFRDESLFVACLVKVSDIADLPAFAQYPDKIRGKGGYTLYEVDENGKKKSTKPLRDSSGRFTKVRP